MRTKNVGTLKNVALSAASIKAVSMYGTAVKEHLAAYSGIDNDLGRTWNRGLKRFSEYKIAADPIKDPKGYYTELKAKAGYSAEVKEVARRRAEEAISGKTPRTIRTDEVKVNHPLFDVTSKVDAAGNPVPGASAQMKFRGKDAEEAIKILKGSDCKKYIENDCKLMVPSDYYDEMKEKLEEQISDVGGQIEHLKKAGKTNALSRRQAELKSLKAIKKNLIKSKVSNAEAQEAYLNPVKSTVKDIAGVAHKSGAQQAGMGAAIGGSISLARNLVEVVKGKKSIEDAALSVTGDAAEAAAASYATAFTGAVLKGCAQNSSARVLRALSKTNAPAFVATATLEIGKTLCSFFQGKIDGTKCVEELGEKGYGMLGSAMYAAVGQTVIPIPVAGALVGGMLGYMISSASYDILRSSLKAAKLAHEERLRIERECDEAVSYLKDCRKELERYMTDEFPRVKALLLGCISSIRLCLDTGDADGYVMQTNALIRNLGGTPLYETKHEFMALMESESPIVL